MTPRILLTGAAGGIGRATALAFARTGASLALLDRNPAGLASLADEIREAGGQASVHAVDLGDLDGLDVVIAEVERALGGLDVLINNAGLLSFRPFDTETAAGLDTLMRVNVTAPMTLIRAALPGMRQRGRGQIVNVGSIFGSIGFAWFSAYSASKFAVRGFSESLRRELAGSDVSVSYVAPRATRTPLASVFGRMAEATGMTLDEPERVAARILRAVQRDQRDVYVGFPECVFVRLNALFPRLVDKALRKQDAVARPFAEEAARAVVPVGLPGTDRGDREGPEPSTRRAPARHDTPTAPAA